MTYELHSATFYGMRAALSLYRHYPVARNTPSRKGGGEFKMKTILAAMFAVMIGLTFVGSTFADEKKMDAPAAAPGTSADTSKKTETKTETKTENKNGKKKKSKKTTKTTEEKAMEKKAP